MCVPQPSRWESWQPEPQPTIRETHFAGLGTRFLQDNGKQAIEELYRNSLG